ncbi:MAG: hypothetical protein ACRDCE_01550 [Cetobacterium sp.]|uniref:hypothetical protein n=1 Tax=Cetobacterium sp. TaxID=2071632 RepID=UPI003EE5B363
MAFSDVLQQYRSMYSMLQSDFGGMAPKQEQRQEEVEQEQEEPQEFQEAMKYLQDFGMANDMSQPQSASGQHSQEDLDAFEKYLNEEPYFKKNGKKIQDTLMRLVEQINDPSDPMDQQQALQMFAEIIEELN